MRKWFLIVTKPHKETYAEEQLNNQGFETYHPLFIQKKKIRGKLKVVKHPCFLVIYLFGSMKGLMTGQAYAQQEVC